MGNGCNLTIKGTGSLAISAAYNGIYVGKCNTTISGSANVTAQSAGGQIRHSIYTDGAFTVSGTPTVTANAGTSTSGAQINAGIYAKGTVSITGGNSADISYGVLRKER